MCINIKETPKIIARYDNSVIINWANVFDYKLNDTVASIIYSFQISNNLSDWSPIYNGSRTRYECKHLAPNTAYKCQLKLIIGGTKKNADIKVDEAVECEESEWVNFNIATRSNQVYVMHLTRAVNFEKTAVIRKIINHRASLLDTISTSSQQTQLYSAVHRSHLAMVQFLLNVGANINTPQPLTLRTPLMLAAFLGNINTLGILINKNPNYRATDINKMNALHYAVDGGHRVIVEQLLKLEEIDVNATDSKGWTPLFRAVIMGDNDEIILKLVRCGANLNLTDKSGYSLEDHFNMVKRNELYKSIRELQNKTIEIDEIQKSSDVQQETQHISLI